VTGRRGASGYEAPNEAVEREREHTKL
jgi:hypothetical protein